MVGWGEGGMEGRYSWAVLFGSLSGLDRECGRENGVEGVRILAQREDVVVLRGRGMWCCVWEM
jgi:hypothetical protein